VCCHRVALSYIAELAKVHSASFFTIDSSIISHGANNPQWARACSLLRLHDPTQTHHTWWDSSARVISPNAETSTFTTHNTHNTQTSMLSDGIRPRSPSKRAVADHALDRAATGIGYDVSRINKCR